MYFPIFFCQFLHLITNLSCSARTGCLQNYLTIWPGGDPWMPNFYCFGFLWRSGKKIKCICYLWKNRRVLFLVFFWYLSTLLVKFSNTFAVFKTNTSKHNREKKLKTKTPNHTNLRTCSSWRLAVLHLALLIGANDYFALCILPGSLSVAGLSPATDNDPCLLLGITWKSAIR